MSKNTVVVFSVVTCLNRAFFCSSTKDEKQACENLLFAIYDVLTNDGFTKFQEENAEFLKGNYDDCNVYALSQVFDAWIGKCNPFFIKKDSYVNFSAKGFNANAKKVYCVFYREPTKNGFFCFVDMVESASHAANLITTSLENNDCYSEKNLHVFRSDIH